MNQYVKQLLIRTKKAVFSQQLGNNTSNIKGEGYDFVELREYEDGEDIRKIDWVISAKMQKPYVKEFYSQRELNINIVPILSGSTHFGTKRFKKDVILEVCSLLGYICVAQGDSYSSYIANENVVLNTKKTKKLFGVNEMIEKIFHYEALTKRCDYKSIVSNLHNQIQKKSILFLIGDFFNTQNTNFELLSKKHEVILIIVRDRFEEHPKALGDVSFIDPSTSSIFQGDLNESLIKNYEAKVKKDDFLFIERLKKAGIEFIKIYTDDNVPQKLAKLFC